MNDGMPSNLLAGINKLLEIGSHTGLMRVAVATLVALLILHFVDEQYNDARYTRAATTVLSNIARSFG
jgi:hypothetical protein